MVDLLHPGVYRGVVVNNADPQGRGRLQLQIPQLSGTEITDWVEPSVNSGVVVPLPGQVVYVAYEGGDARYPVWIGMGTGQGATPGVSSTNMTLPLNLKNSSGVTEFSVDTSGNTIASGTLNVTGTSTLGNLNVNGNTTLTSHVNGSGPTITNSGTGTSAPALTINDVISSRSLNIGIASSAGQFMSGTNPGDICVQTPNDRNILLGLTPTSNLYRKRISTSDVPTTYGMNGWAISTDWTWPAYLDSSDDCWYRVTDGMAYAGGRIITNAAGPYADPLSLYAPFNSIGAMSKINNTNRGGTTGSGPTVGYWQYVYNSGAGWAWGWLEAVNDQSNHFYAVASTGGLFSVQPAQYDRFNFTITGCPVA